MTKPLLDSSIPESQGTCNPSTRLSAPFIGQVGTEPSRTWPLYPRPTPTELIQTEEKIRALWEAGELPFLTHLDGSIDGYLENRLCDFFHCHVKPTDWVLASHRCHYVYQLHGGQNIIEEVKDGRSMFLSGRRFISSAIVAGTCSIAVGLGMAIQARRGKEMAFCFIGDAASEHGHALEAIGYVQSKGLPVHFVILDNNSSCGVTKEQRRGSAWEWEWPPCVTKIEYTPRWQHAGSGVRPTLKWKP